VRSPSDFYGEGSRCVEARHVSVQRRAGHEQHSTMCSAGLDMNSIHQ
jgi:hypothetical protein